MIELRTEFVNKMYRIKLGKYNYLLNVAMAQGQKHRILCENLTAKQWSLNLLF